jgi:hypothetical protein
MGSGTTPIGYFGFDDVADVDGIKVSSHENCRRYKGVGIDGDEVNVVAVMIDEVVVMVEYVLWSHGDGDHGERPHNGVISHAIVR